MRIAVALILLMLASARAESAWRDVSETDKLTGQKVAMQALRAKSSIRQFGRAVSVQLVIRCDNPYDDRKRFKSDDHYSAYLLFSERVGVGDVLVRYTFDGGSPVSRTFSFAGRGSAIFLSTIRAYDDFIEPLRKSARLRIELNLPWAGSPIAEFDTGGVEQAFTKVPCG